MQAGSQLVSQLAGLTNIIALGLKPQTTGRGLNPTQYNRKSGVVKKAHCCIEKYGMKIILNDAVVGTTKWTRKL